MNRPDLPRPDELLVRNTVTYGGVELLSWEIHSHKLCFVIHHENVKSANAREALNAVIRHNGLPFQIELQHGLIMTAMVTDGRRIECNDPSGLTFIRFEKTSRQSE